VNQAQLRLQKEHRYRELLEQAAEGVCLTDQGFGLLLVNQAFCDMFGYTQDELLGMNMAALVLAQDQELLASQLADILQGKTVYSEQFLRRKDGSSIQVEGSGKLIQ
jgi:PAS domain S-box-containing protein